MSMDSDGPISRKGKKRSQDNVAPKQGRPAFGFTNIPISESDKERILSEVQSETSIVDWLKEMAVDGYRVGITFDSNSDAFNVAFTSIAEGRADDNRCVTSRNSLLEVAFTIAIFKWRMFCEYGIPAPAELTLKKDVFD